MSLPLTLARYMFASSLGLLAFESILVRVRVRVRVRV